MEKIKNDKDKTNEAQLKKLQNRKKNLQDKIGECEKE